MSAGCVEMTTNRPAIAPYKDVLGRFCTGVTVVTSFTQDGPTGFTCQTFSSLSLDPPLVQFSVRHASTSWPRIRETGRFAVSILAASHADLATRFACSGIDKFAGQSWSTSPAGLPIFHGVLAWLECALVDEVSAGDHAIVIGAVEGMQVDQGQEPLLFFRGDLISSSTVVTR